MSERGAVKSALWVVVGLAGSVLISTAQVPQYDLVITNARVVDGTGNPWFRADVGVRGDTIVFVGKQVAGTATRTVDAAGRVLAPGFIDLHVHALEQESSTSEVLRIVAVPSAENYVRQGVTTLIGGPDGASPVPLAPALEAAANARIVPNLGAFIGHNSVRNAVMNNVNRVPRPEELDRMRTIVRSGMRDGAFGLSTGLLYVPGAFSKTDEVIALAAVAGEMGGIHISHMRDEEAGVMASVRETIAIGEGGGLPTQISHHKAVGKAVWGKTVDTLRLVDEARQRGVDATLDVYPYIASSNGIGASLIPGWAREGTREDTLARLRDPQTRRRVMLQTITSILEGRGAGDPHNVLIARCDWNPALAGQRLDDAAVWRGKSKSLEDAADTVLWIQENGGCAGVYFAMTEDDVQRVLKHPASMIASDGEVVRFGLANPHPRSYGTFARVLGRYVRELKVLTLEEAIRKMTSFPARRIGLVDRGVIREGMKADLVLFDPLTVRDMATFERPHQYAEGVSMVMINGQIVLENGSMTTARPGRILRGPGLAP